MLPALPATGGRVSGAARTRAVGNPLARPAAVRRVLLRGPLSRLVLVARLSAGTLAARLSPAVTRAIAVVLAGRLAGLPVALDLVAGAAAGVLVSLLPGRRSAALGVGVGTGTAGAGLVGLLPAPLLTAAGTIARRIALGI